MLRLHQAIDPIEYLHHGDIASVATQYSYLASWMSLLVEPGYDQADILDRRIAGDVERLRPRRAVAGVGARRRARRGRCRDGGDLQPDRDHRAGRDGRPGRPVPRSLPEPRDARDRRRGARPRRCRRIAGTSRGVQRGRVRGHRERRLPG
ncbi:MAG: alpha/beta-hydrolase family protein [Microbacterium sp.]|nr:alpha/beta-hydrolase family protein [Microbacterium sp.]